MRYVIQHIKPDLLYQDVCREVLTDGCMCVCVYIYIYMHTNGDSGHSRLSAFVFFLLSATQLKVWNPRDLYQLAHYELCKCNKPSLF